MGIPLLTKKIIFLFLSSIVFSFCGLSQNKTIDIYDLSIQELSKFKVISATKSEQETDEVQSTIRVITKSEILERGYFTLDELLADLPGFQFRNIMSLNSYVFQRGVTNQNNLTLVLIDGVQLNELNSGGFYAGAQYNLSNIDRVEVVYGPCSVAYGTNAVTGVINIITSNAQRNEGNIKTLTGNFNTYLSDISFSGVNKENEISYHVAAMVKHSDKANLKGEYGDFNWSDLMDNFENDYSFGVKLKYKDFTLGTNYLQKQTSTATLYPSIGTIYRDYGTFWNILFVNNYLRYQKFLSPKLKLTATVYNRNTTVLKNSIYFVLDTAQVGYYRPNNLTGFETVVNYKPGNLLSLTGGLSFEFESLAKGPSLTYSNGADIKPPVPLKPQMNTDFLSSFFIEPSMKLYKSLFLSGGMRFDVSTLYDKVVTPRAGLRYNLGKHSVRVNFAEAFRAPKPWDYTDGLGNPELKPEKLTSFETSFSFLLFKDLNVGLNFYSNRLVNGIIKETVDNSYRWINSTQINTLGSEFDLTYFINRLRLNFNYSYTNSKNELGQIIPEISKHTANLILSYSISDKWNFNIRANYVGQRENPKIIKSTNSTLVNEFIIFNGSVNWKPSRDLDISLIGKNILDEVYYHTSNRLPDRYRQPQRTILLTMAYHFNVN